MLLLEAVAHKSFLALEIFTEDVEVTDNLAATSRPACETFRTVRTALSGELFRGVSFAPET